MVPSNVDVDMAPATPPPASSSAMDVNALKDKDSAAQLKDTDVDLPTKEGAGAEAPIPGKASSTTVGESAHDINSKGDDGASASATVVTKENIAADQVEKRQDVNLNAALLPNGAHAEDHSSKVALELVDAEDEDEDEHSEHGHGNGHGHGHEHNDHQHAQDERHRDNALLSHHEGDDEDHEMDHDARHPSEKKYKRLKRKLKEVLEENERLSVELDRSNRRARNLRQEKNLLLDRLCSFEQNSDSSPDTMSSMSSDSDLSESSFNSYYHHHHHRHSRKPSPSTRPLAASVAPPTPSKKNQHLRVPGTGRSADPVPSITAHHPKKTASKSSTSARKSPAVSGRPAKEEKPASTPSTITNVGSATQKPKRIHNTSKLRPVLSNKVRKVQAIERDENGNVILPVTVGIITIMDLGHVVYDREAFHNERYIWPVGYKMSRSYNSMIDQTQQTIYTCSVVDDGEAPKFQIDAEDQPGKPIIAGTATGAWTHVVKAANLIRKRDHSNSASGPDYFGFSNATIAKMIQDLPNTDKCKTYIFQRYEEPGTASGKGASSSGTSEKRKISAVVGPKKKQGKKAATAADADAEVGAEADAAENGEGDLEGEGEGDEDEDQVEEVDEDDEDVEGYASLGTPGRKKVKRSTSPKIRQAGFGAKGGEDAEGQEVEVDELAEEDEDENEDEEVEVEVGEEDDVEEEENQGNIDELEDEEMLSQKDSEDVVEPSSDTSGAVPASMDALTTHETAKDTAKTARQASELEPVDIEEHDTNMETAVEEPKAATTVLE